MHLDFTAAATNLFNRVNFNRVSDQFDINGVGTPGCPFCVTTADGPLNLLTGPYTGLHGVKPTSRSQITSPLFYSGADLPRQIQLGLILNF